MRPTGPLVLCLRNACMYTQRRMGCDSWRELRNGSCNCHAAASRTNSRLETSGVLF
jgi:hypothetical protein